MLSRSFALRLELGEVPITGHLTDAHGVCTPFAGWIQLVALIEQAGDPATTDDAARAAPSAKLPRRHP